MNGTAERMLITCPFCGRSHTVEDGSREVRCDCGRAFDPLDKPTVADPFLGQSIQGYRIEEVVGRGGMGTVYRAVQESLGRAVAFKVLPPDVGEQPQFRERFHREAEILSAFAHENVVRIIDRGEWEGRCFLVMEFIEGVNLRRVLRKGPVPIDRAVRMTRRILRGLEYAHARGVVHRDIKPENVLLDEEGAIKIVDFGLSRVLDPSDDRTRLTRTHFVLGTYEYMAPELREGTRDADARADLYAAGVILFEMVAGELPIGRFEMPGPDGRLHRILEKALQKDPARRYQSAKEFRAALEGMSGVPEKDETLTDILGEAAARVAGASKDLWQRARVGERLGRATEHVTREAKRVYAEGLFSSVFRWVGYAVDVALKIAWLPFRIVFGGDEEDDGATYEETEAAAAEAEAPPPVTPSMVHAEPVFSEIAEGAVVERTPSGAIPPVAAAAPAASVPAAAIPLERARRKGVRIERRYDFFLGTLLLMALIAIVGGAVLMADNEDFELGAYDLDRGEGSGIPLIVFGTLLMFGVHGARRFGETSRRFVFFLLLLLVPTGFLAVFAFWALWALLNPLAESYLNARSAGHTPEDAYRIAALETGKDWTSRDRRHGRRHAGRE